MEFKKFAVGLHHYGDDPDNDEDENPKKQEPYVNFHDKDDTVKSLLKKDINDINDEDEK